MPTFEPLAPPVSDGTPAADGALQTPISLESLLMRFRLITSEQLDQALREKTETGKDVGAIVVERGWVNEDQLSRLLAYAPAFPAGSEVPVAAQPEPAVEAPAEPMAEPQPELVPAEQPEPVLEAQPEPTFEIQPDPSSENEHVTVPAFEFEQAQEIQPETPAEAEAEPVGDFENPFEPDPAVEMPRAFDSVAQVPMLPPALELIEEIQPVASEQIVTPEPVAEVEPLSEIVPAPEPVEEQQPEAQAAFEPQPVPVDAAPDPVATPEATPQTAEVAAEPEPQVVRFVEPAALDTIARVFVRLSNGERVEAGSFDDIADARTLAEEVVRQVSDNGNGWPFFGGRFIRPEAIVSVDVDATVVRYA